MKRREERGVRWRARIPIKGQRPALLTNQQLARDFELDACARRERYRPQWRLMQLLHERAEFDFANWEIRSESSEGSEASVVVLLISLDGVGGRSLSRYVVFHPQL